MKSINITIDSSIHLNPQNLPKNVLDEIFNQLRIPNPQKAIAEREMLWGADDVPEYLELWKYNGHNELILPRGFIIEFENILEHNNVEMILDDETAEGDRKFVHQDILSKGMYLRGPDYLRNYQENAFEKLNNYQCGIYKAPTGSGKTMVMLETIRRNRVRAIVFVEKRDIASQWILAAEKFGFKNIGFIGDSICQDDRDLVIALRQSVWSKRKTFESFWYEQFGMVIWDEVHHIQAETAFDLIQRFPAKFRYGCSATPDSDPELFPIISAVIGPVVATSSPEEIGEHLVIPSVKVVKTEFEFDYRPTVRAGNKVFRNNYNGMIECLEKDRDRNIHIAELISEEFCKGYSCLIYSSRKKHLNLILREINKLLPSYEHYPTFVLTSDNSKEYSMIKKTIEESENGSILLSTLANEGTDIQRLDRLFLVYPGRKVRGCEQAIGRIMRPHPKKKDAIVYDFRDYKIPILNSQYRHRAQEIYNKKNYKVETINE